MPGKVLVVDDVATNRIILKVKLASACYDVLQAAGGQEAYDIACTESPDVILLDMAMPDMSGIEVCRLLKSDPNTADIPVIVVTAHSDRDTRLAALEAGAEEYMIKPLNDLHLLARVRSLLRARDINSELALREGTSQALGFAESGAEFVGPGRIALVASDPDLALEWQKEIAARISDRIEVMDPKTALQDITPEHAPDLFVLSSSLKGIHDPLRLLCDLRSRSATRHSGILVSTDEGARETAAMALDLGASDLLCPPFDPEEVALRLKTQMARKRQADRLRRRVRDGLQLAVTDPLTGLYNRRYAMSHLARVQARSEQVGKGFAVLLIDLDQFKTVNDQFGHAAGDAVLRGVADRLSANLRSVDLIARVGGEEFLIVLPDISQAPAYRAAERLRHTVEGMPFEIPPSTCATSGVTYRPPITQTVSIGLAMGGGAPDTDDDMEHLLERADRALYASKSEGRNQVSLARAVA